MTMAESPESGFLRGTISRKAANKHLPGVLKQTRVNPGFGKREEPFDGKQGRGDQAGADWNKPLDGGDKSVAGTGHINTKKDMGSRARASGGPSRGGSAGGQRQPIRRSRIDEGDAQKP